MTITAFDLAVAVPGFPLSYRVAIRHCGP